MSEYKHKFMNLPGILGIFSNENIALKTTLINIIDKKPKNLDQKKRKKSKFKVLKNLQNPNP